MKKILVVDDDVYQGILYEQEFEDMGYQVITTESGKQAIRVCLEEKPDLVIIDLVLPDIHGLNVIARILEKNPKIPVIINSAYPHYRNNFKSWAADKYILKSSDLSELKTAINEILSGENKAKNTVISQV
jgi:DNA-binding response OmpR family regulator